MSVAAARGSALVLWYGGKLVMAGTMKIGELVGFLFFLALFYEPVSRLHGLNQMLQAARAAGERVFDILDATEERSDSAKSSERRAPALRETQRAELEFRAPIWRARGDVRYENISFSYGNDRSALKNISLHAQPGEMIALVGPTGAGKS